MLHSRTQLIDASGIRKVFDLAADLRDPINLSIGQPDFDVPEPVKQAAMEAIRAGHNRYTVTQGITELREAVRDHLNETRRTSYDTSNILITSGVSGGLLLAFLSLFGPGDEVIIPDPYFVMYKHLLRILGATPVFADTYPDFRFTAERIEPLISEKTKAIVIGSPSNPTGVVVSETEWKEIVSLVAKKNLLLISDEIYDAFVYDGSFHSPAALHENVLLLGGFSKSHAMTGWRIGFAAGDKDLINAMTTFQQFTFVCAPSMVQHAALEALKTKIGRYREAYRRKRDLLLTALSPYYEIVGAEGAFYLFPKAPGGDATSFCTRAISEKQLLIIPGSVFSERDTHFRISYAADETVLERGIEALIALAPRA
ncbi:MAG: pyridoxal phosphate-dependent aminotransferase [Candidatus Hydrogenedentota bacterium]|nr:MAG: pyridoxal phosphate-dependent aminotransferase [Candidatus Hydrogenedentota bacterium]